MFLQCFKLSKNKKDVSSQKNKQSLMPTAKDAKKEQKNEKKEEPKVHTPTTPKPDIDEAKLTTKEERIAQGRETRKKTDYATFLDVCSDWDDTSHSQEKKKDDIKIKKENLKPPKNDVVNNDAKNGNENKPEKKSENKIEEKANKDNERKSEKETKGEDDSTQKEGGQVKPTPSSARTGETSATQDSKSDSVGAAQPTQTAAIGEEKKAQKNNTKKLNTV